VQPRGVGDRPARDPEGAELDAVARALVVVGEHAVGGAERGRAGGDVEPLGRGVAVEGLKHRLARGQQAAEPHGLAHGLGVLELVADHHLVHHRVDPAGVDGRQRPLADLRQVLARAVGVEQLDLAAHGARRLEGVVARGELGTQQRLVGEAVHEPQVLVGRDVPQVPRERAHDRVDLALELLVVEVRDDREGAFAGGGEGVDEGLGHRERDLGHLIAADRYGAVGLPPLPRRQGPGWRESGHRATLLSCTRTLSLRVRAAGAPSTARRRSGAGWRSSPSRS
jgi:hypothetical protein